MWRAHTGFSALEQHRANPIGLHYPVEPVFAIIAAGSTQRCAQATAICLWMSQRHWKVIVEWMSEPESVGATVLFFLLDLVFCLFDTKRAMFYSDSISFQLFEKIERWKIRIFKINGLHLSQRSFFSGMIKPWYLFKDPFLMYQLTGTLFNYFFLEIFTTTI